jgi:hypothetical protein
LALDAVASVDVEKVENVCDAADPKKPVLIEMGAAMFFLTPNGK